MNNTQEITEFDLSLLPGWDEGLKCESAHEYSSCTGEVTHRTNHEGHQSQVFICTGAASAVLRVKSQRPMAYCPDCPTRIGRHWSVVPV